MLRKIPALPEQYANKNGADDGEREQSAYRRPIEPPKLLIQKLLIAPSHGDGPSEVPRDHSLRPFRDRPVIA
jgi:hypothetical protein